MMFISSLRRFVLIVLLTIGTVVQFGCHCSEVPSERNQACDPQY